MFNGSMVALITPMHDDGSIDTNAFHDLIEWHIAAKTDALIIAGTTGESATLDHREHLALIESAVKQAAKRIPIIAGTGTNATRSTIALTLAAKEAGADGALIVTPYYNKPTQAGLYAHYKAIAQAVKWPIILYNVPSRTGCDLLPETVGKLAAIEHIIAIKEATGKLDRVKAIHDIAPNFTIYSGDDESALELMTLGAKGVISVTANIAPDKMHAMCQAVLQGDIEKAKAINTELQALHQTLFIESNPIPAKWALHRMGKIENGIRLPLLPLTNECHESVQRALQTAGVITS